MMKSIKEYSKENTGIALENTKCLDEINKAFSFDRLINKKNNNIVLRDVVLKEDIELPNKKIIKKGTEFPKIELTTTKKLKLFKLSENSVKPYKILLKHSLNEDMFPTYQSVPVIWNDGRIDGPFYPDRAINNIILNGISCISKIKEEIMKLPVEEVSILLQGLGNSFEEQVIREVIKTYMKMSGHPIEFGLANGV